MRWIYKELPKDQVEKLAKELNVSEYLASLLIRLEITDKQGC